ncbi:shikimate dehydrogenase family protein [Mariluticola halotolerans]|uniref:shikimate dehydrogenase family protein n=1 Tax=Mariluticola halotolerans TaxID=2909283 RepID=UPI0026E1531C|nr:shikimate dehydrogenase [Mariluticola halotolerans]UJQ94111.1 shikimate dehydrogenase [Mariluticola halotolerans]
MNVSLDGETRLFFIVGDPITQVKSPGRLTEILVARGENALLVPAHVRASDLADFFAMARRAENVDGIVVTVPHKPASLALADHVTERARFAGSVNVVRRDADGTWFADNTDGHGYLEGIAARDFDVNGKSVLLVGAGGAGSAVAYEFLARGASRLSISEVDHVRRDAILERLEIRFPGRSGLGSADPEGYDLIANVTPMGMRETDPLPVEADKLIASQFVADAITKPAITPLLEIAGAKGCKTMPGLGMFDAQAELLVDFLLGRNFT